MTIDAKRYVLTVDEAAELLGIGRNAAYEAVKRGEIPTIRLGKKILVLRLKLLEMLGAPDAAPTRAD